MGRLAAPAPGLQTVVKNDHKEARRGRRKEENERTEETSEFKQEQSRCTVAVCTVLVLLATLEV